jgi:uncharacterized damage-inducible protein DinB
MRDIPDLLEGLRRSPKILTEFVKTVPGNSINRRRGESFWTIAEHVTHLAEVQPMLLERLQRFMSEDHPEFIPYIPGDHEDQTRPLEMDMAAALGRFAKTRELQLGLLEGADDTTWQKAGTHPEYESYSLYILGRHILMHDFWHMYRMEELWLAKDAYLTRLE